MPTKRPSKTEEIIGKIFKNNDAAYGLKEFEGIDIFDVLEITEEERGRYYLKDLKTGQTRFVYDEKKESGKPEEIIRQLWLYKLNMHYKYPLDRMDTERSIHFGREIHSKAVDVVVFKPDKITPYILIEVKAPSESKGIDR
jgi:type I restriction enzyme M protein